MNDNNIMQETWSMVIKHLIGQETQEETEAFSLWLNKSEKNKLFFDKVKSIWDYSGNAPEPFKHDAPTRFFGRFTKKKIKEFILKQALGNLIGFIVGMWVTALFSHRVLERRGLHNLFGLAGRRKVVVNEIPEWLQNGIAIIVGFIVLELINHFFQTKQHIAAWRCFKRLLGKRIA